MSKRDKNEALIIEAQTLAKEYIELLRTWIPKRKEAVKEIRDIGRDLEDVNKYATIAKVISGGIAVAGGVAAIAGTFTTGGLAAPLLRAGIASAVPVSVTSAGTDIDDHYLRKGKLETAQSILNADSELIRKIEAKKSQLTSKVESLSHTVRLSTEQVFGALLMTTQPDTKFPDNGVSVFKLLKSTAIFHNLLQKSFGVETKLGKGIISTFAEVSMKGATKVIGKVLSRVVMGEKLVFDVYSLVKDSVELAKGSQPTAATSLRQIALGLEEQADNTNDLLEQIRRETSDYEEQIRQQFRRLLDKVSAQGYASDDDGQTIYNYMCTYSCEAWRHAFNSLSADLTTVAFSLARVFRNIGKTMEDYMNEHDPEKQRHLHITLIAHGRINTNVAIPSHIYYMTPAIESVTLYSPWGCAVDATVVYGIATNTIQTQNVDYSAQVVPQRPWLWNNLPRDQTMTPNVVFSPVMHGEGAHQSLLELIALLQGTADGLVIPYFTGLGVDVLPFPEIPLWVCANVVCICGDFLQVSCSLRIAACLSPEHVLNEMYLPNLNQYCQVAMNMNPPAFMTNHGTINERMIAALRRLQTTLPL